MSHTPGPWTLHEIWPSGPGFSITAEGKTYQVCGCGAYQHSHPGASYSDEECRANARLIAAAPDLLEALKFALSEDSGFACPAATEKRLLAVIAKAEGR
jgi:hypothetical protein